MFALLLVSTTVLAVTFESEVVDKTKIEEYIKQYDKSVDKDKVEVKSFTETKTLIIAKIKVNNKLATLITSKTKSFKGENEMKKTAIIILIITAIIAILLIAFLIFYSKKTDKESISIDPQRDSTFFPIGEDRDKDSDDNGDDSPRSINIPKLRQIYSQTNCWVHNF